MGVSTHTHGMGSTQTSCVIWIDSGLEYIADLFVCYRDKFKISIAIRNFRT